MSARDVYWCHPQAGGHRTLYFLGHQHITRAEYVEAVGAADCDPHIFHGRTTVAKKRKKAAKRGLIDTGRTSATCGVVPRAGSRRATT